MKNKIAIKYFIKSLINIHKPNKTPNIFIFSTPRSGSTWLRELLLTQPGFKCCDEPFNLRNYFARKYLNMSNWEEIYQPESESKIYKYFSKYCNGKLTFLDCYPFIRYYRLLTYRIVFKIIHGGEDRINWFKNKFNGEVIYLLRHPIAVSLSRKQFPRLNAFINSRYKDHFTKYQIEYSKKIISLGTKLEKGILSWCLQNYVPLTQANEDWIILSYEQMVLEPNKVWNFLKKRLSLSKIERIYKLLKRPSSTVYQSDKKTRQIFSNNNYNPAWLIKKWKKKVGEEEEKKLMDILAIFGISAYKSGDFFPSRKLIID